MWFIMSYDNIEHCRPQQRAESTIWIRDCYVVLVALLFVLCMFACMWRRRNQTLCVWIDGYIDGYIDGCKRCMSCCKATTAATPVYSVPSHRHVSKTCHQPHAIAQQPSSISTTAMRQRSTARMSCGGSSKQTR